MIVYVTSNLNLRRCGQIRAYRIDLIEIIMIKCEYRSLNARASVIFRHCRRSKTIAFATRGDKVLRERPFARQRRVNTELKGIGLVCDCTNIGLSRISCASITDCFF